MDEATTRPPPASLVARFGPDDLDLLEPGARSRFVRDDADWDAIAPQLAWELLYRKEPELYDRLIRGERIHPRVVDTLPRARCCVEIAAGSGRLTRDLVGRCDRVIAVEPAQGLRDMLAVKHPGVHVRHGYFDATGLPDDSADLVVSCASFTAECAHGGDAGLREFDRIAMPGAMVAFVWPCDIEWLRERGFTYESHPADMEVEFESMDEAIELSRIFYPHAVDDIASRGSRRVPYDVLGMNPPCDIAWKVVE